MSKLTAPTSETLTEFYKLCRQYKMGKPHFVLLRKDSKLPARKGYMENPVGLADVLSNLDRYDVGLVPASIHQVVFDNDAGGISFIQHLEEKFGEGTPTITPSSSGKAGRNHVWFTCPQAYRIGNDAIYLEDNRVGELRASKGYIRLTEDALRVLIRTDQFWDQILTDISERDVRQFTKSKSLDFTAVGLGEDSGAVLPENIETSIHDEFEVDPSRRSELIYKWTGILTRRGYSPAEIVRFLSLIPAVADKISEKSYDLPADVCRIIGRQQAEKDFDVNGEDLRDWQTIMQDWVWVSVVERFIRKSDGLSFSRSQFMSHFQRLAPGRKLQQAIFNGDTPIQLFESATYLPGKPQALGNLFNTYRPSEVVPCSGNTKVIEEHLEKLFPDPVDRDLFLDFLHFVVTRPELKLMFALVVHGQQGIGKTAIARLVRRVLGEHNVSCPSPSEFRERFTGWQKDVSLAVIEELMMGGKFELANQMKPVITNDTLRIELKGIDAISVPNVMNIIAFTNHRDAVKLEADDRRWLILSSPMKPQTAEYYERLFAWIESDEAPGAFLKFLQERKPTLNPKGRAPSTAAKRDMLDASRSETEQLLMHWRDEGEGPFVNDLFRFKEVAEELSSHRLPTRPNELKKELARIGAIRHPRLKSPGEPATTLWSIRNHDALAELTARERLAKYQSQD